MGTLLANAISFGLGWAVQFSVDDKFPTRCCDVTLLQALHFKLSDIGAGPGWTASQQAATQLYALGITLALAVITGLATGVILNIEFLFHGLKDHELFEDYEFFDGVGEEPLEPEPETPEPVKAQVLTPPAHLYYNLGDGDFLLYLALLKVTLNIVHT